MNGLTVIITSLVLLGVGACLGYLLHNMLAKGHLARAKSQADELLSNARKEAEGLKKEKLVEAKDELYKARNDFEKETKDRRIELQNLEKRILQKEDNLDRKYEQIDRKDKQLTEKENQLEKRVSLQQQKEQELEDTIQEQKQTLENISGITAEEAKAILIEKMENEARYEAAKKIRQIEKDAVETADKKANELISLAVQRYASEHIVESSVSVVALPNDEMKGRIIGREGRNIRAFETATGVDLIIDDTPEAVVISGFDPIRREIARLSLEKLIVDGRIHPAQIEELVNKVRKKMDISLIEEGERVLFDLNIHEVHPELVKLMGRLKYRTSYGQNVLKHSEEVAYLTGIMAAELGLDETLARRAGLLHDIGKAMDHEIEGTHVQIGANQAKKYGESPIVVQAIASHHNDEEQESIIAILVQAADAISAARPGARRETLETYVKRLEKLENIADSFKGVDKSFAIQAGREVRVVVENEAVDDIQALQLSRDIARKIEEELQYPGRIKVTVIREYRATEYAK